MIVTNPQPLISNLKGHRNWLKNYNHKIIYIEVSKLQKQKKYSCLILSIRKRVTMVVGKWRKNAL